MALSAKSEWSKENNQHNFVELLAFYRHQLLPVNPSSIAAVKDAATYDTSISFDENMANYTEIISALQPYELVTEYQKLEKLKDMTNHLPTVKRALNNYYLLHNKIEKQSLNGAIRHISREMKNNPAEATNTTINSISMQTNEDLMEISSQVMLNQESQEAEINQLKARINELAKVATKPPTKYYCHLHGSNNTHNGAECKKMGSPNFTMKGKMVTQAMIDNRVPGKVVDGVAGKK